MARPARGQRVRRRERKIFNLEWHTFARPLTIPS